MRLTIPTLLALALVAVSASAEPLWVQGTAMSALYNHVSVWEGSTPVNDATVSVNAVELPWAADGFYSGILPAELSSGALVTLVVERPGWSPISATDVLPEKPVIHGPADGAAFPSDGVVPVSWTASSMFDEIIVQVLWDGGNFSWTIDGSLTSFDVPADQLPTDTQCHFTIYGYVHGDWVGDVTPDSKMKLRVNSDYSPVVTVEAVSPVDSKTWATIKAMYRD